MTLPPKPGPRVQRQGDSWGVEVPGDARPYQVLSWNPPHLVLTHGSEVRHFFLQVTRDGIWLGHGGRTQLIPRPNRRRSSSASIGPGHDDLSSPMPGKVLEVLVEEGRAVAAGERLLVIEAMKMEHPLVAPHTSTVTKIHVSVGDSVSPGDTLIELDSD